MYVCIYVYISAFARIRLICFTTSRQQLFFMSKDTPPTYTKLFRLVASLTALLVRIIGGLKTDPYYSKI